MSSSHRLESDRRDFLKLAGFSLAALTVPGCGRAPEHEAVPFLEKPEELTPGRTTYYATLCQACSAGCGLLASYRDGRPIKLEGSPEHPLSGGTTCARGQAHVLSLYDSRRLKAPRAAGAASTWDAVDAAITQRLKTVRENGGAVRVLTGTVTGPTVQAAIDELLAGFGDGRHVMYDALSSAAILDAYAEGFGRRLLPRMHFERAEVIAGFDADFLGTWVSPVEFTRMRKEGRDLAEKGKRFSRHIQFETRPSVTGADADERHGVAPGDIGALLSNLAVYVGRLTKAAVAWEIAPVPGVSGKLLHGLAEHLVAAPRGRSLVVCGSNRIEDQRLAMRINEMLGNHGGTADGTTLDVEATSRQRLGDDRALAALLAEMQAGKVAALFVAGCNPFYDLPEGEALAAAWQKVGLVVNLAGSLDETAATPATHFVCPDHHPLESWGDAQAVEGLVSVAQPVIQPLGKTRPLVESFTTWAGKPRTAYAFMREVWKRDVHPHAMDGGGFVGFWIRAVYDGFAWIAGGGAGRPAWKPDTPGGGVAPAARSDGALLARMHPQIAMADGRHAHNPWLLELPDPITKVSWDNVAAVAPETAARLGVEIGDVLRLEADGVYVEAPALPLAGMHPDAVALALGYGRVGTDRFAGVGPAWIEARSTVAKGDTVGVRTAGLLARDGGRLVYGGRALRVTKTGARQDVPRSQLWDSLTPPTKLGRSEDGPRPIVQEATLAAWREDPRAGEHAEHEWPELWDDDHKYKNHHWGLAVDLTACTGCSACVVACQAENNIPVVGKDEMRRKRDMHWMRIDRYFDDDGPDASIVHQPMMCQQCDNAPCETVCPVLATTHSDEGLNQQIYNRCVGTRYCSNNCPYKARRFNWFFYRHDDRLQNMVLNPDVTVRSRGVMEKCTFCVQRIQRGKGDAKEKGRPLADGDIQTACMQVCPAGAIVFGDRNDPKSRVSQAGAEERAYRVLDDLGVRPSVSYLRRIRHREGGKTHE